MLSCHGTGKSQGKSKLGISQGVQKKSGKFRILKSRKFIISQGKMIQNKNILCLPLVREIQNSREVKELKKKLEFLNKG